MSPPFLDAQRLRELLPMRAAVDALQKAFAAEQLPASAPRAHVPAGDGELLVMPAAGDAGAGVKLVTVNPANPERGLPLIQGVYVLFDPETLAPELLVDGAALTELRTAAVSGLATRLLAKPEARHLMIFGAGAQAHAHLEAMRAERPIEEVTVVARTRESAAELAAVARAAGLPADIGEPHDVERADIVCTCTTSREPVFDGARLPTGAHVNAIGAYQVDARELDNATVSRGKLVVESRAVALTEAGDILIPLRAGVIQEGDLVADLQEACRGKVVRTSAADITVFKSVGMALEDLVVVRAAAERLAS